MKRYAAVCGFSSAAGLLFAVYALSENLKVLLFLLIICFFLFLFSILIKSLRKNKIIPAVLLSLSLSFSVLFVNTILQSHIINRYENKNVDISAHFINLAENTDGRYRYTIKTDTINGKTEKLKIYLSLEYPLNAKINDEIYISCKLLKDCKNKPYYLNRLSKGILLSANKINSLSVSENAAFSKSKDVSVFVLKLRSILENNILSNLRGQNGALLAGLCFGDKGNISRRIITDFQTCGISHLLAVSGIHLTVWTGFIYFILNKLKLNRKVTAVICLGFILFFSALTGFGISVIRAGFMLGLFYIGFLFNKEPDGINSIGAALCFLLLINPFSAVSISLWFSVLSTVGLILLSKPLFDIFIKPFRSIKNKFVLKPVYFVLSSVSVSVSATVFCIPIYVFVFPTISLLQIISNLIFVFIGSAAMVMGGFSSILFAVKALRLGRLFLSVAGFLSDVLIKGVENLSGYRYSIYPLFGNVAKVSLVILFFTVLSVFLKKFNKSIAYKRFMIVFTAFIIIVNMAFYFDGYLSLRLSFLNFKSGSSVVASYRGQHIVLSSSEDYYNGANMCDILYKHGAGFVDLAVVQGPLKNARPLQRVGESYRIKTAVFNDGISAGYIRSKEKILMTEAKRLAFSRYDDYMEVSADGSFIIFYVNGKKLVVDLTEEQNTRNIIADLYISNKSVMNTGDFDVIIKHNGKIKINR